MVQIVSEVLTSVPFRDIRGNRYRGSLAFAQQVRILRASEIVSSSSRYNNL